MSLANYMIMLFFEKYSSWKHTLEEKMHKSYVQRIFFSITDGRDQ